MGKPRPLPANVPPIPDGAACYTEIRSRVKYTVYDADDCRWRFNPRGLTAFIRYSNGSPVQVITGHAYKEPRHREGLHIVSDIDMRCVRCGATYEARMDNLPETKTCRRR